MSARALRVRRRAAASRSFAAASVLAAAALAGCGGSHPKVAIVKPGSPVLLVCTHRHPYDAREVLGFSVQAARGVLTRRGCTMRVIEANRQVLPHTAEYVRGRVDVGIEKAHVVRVLGES